jgi:hypothetical protein
MIGGSNTAAQPDEGDKMFGGSDQDVMAGDNAAVTRPGGSEIDGTTIRSVTLHDLSSGNSDQPHSGQDDMQGDEGNDDMYGGGEADTINGNAGDDLIEGNGSSDTLLGDAGQDDIIGGTSQGSGGQPDAADTIYGGSNEPDPTLTDDFDVIAGDNATSLPTRKEWCGASSHSTTLPRRQPLRPLIPAAATTSLAKTALTSYTVRAATKSVCRADAATTSCMATTAAIL